ncbi:hypothetical protein [Chlorobium phaeobacteroides]|nr:hypothetical protein [Chlorobium phaeobacteroides]MBV5326717.1 hypothetical protein [Chlorobium sp.]
MKIDDYLLHGLLNSLSWQETPIESYARSAFRENRRINIRIDESDTSMPSRPPASSYSLLPSTHCSRSMFHVQHPTSRLALNTIFFLHPPNCGLRESISLLFEPEYPVRKAANMTGNQNFVVTPGKTTINLFFATGFVIIPPPVNAALEALLLVIQVRLYVSNGASLSPPTGSFGLLAGLGFGLLAGLGFGLITAEVPDCLSCLAVSVDGVMITSFDKGFKLRKLLYQ